MHWRKDDRTIASETRVSLGKISENSLTLGIKHLLPEDIGNCTCVASTAARSENVTVAWWLPVNMLSQVFFATMRDARSFARSHGLTADSRIRPSAEFRRSPRVKTIASTNNVRFDSLVRLAWAKPSTASVNGGMRQAYCRIQLKYPQAGNRSINQPINQYLFSEKFITFY